LKWRGPVTHPAFSAGGPQVRIGSSLLRPPKLLATAGFFVSERCRLKGSTFGQSPDITGRSVRIIPASVLFLCRTRATPAYQRKDAFLRICSTLAIFKNKLFREGRTYYSSFLLQTRVPEGFAQLAKK
jgi:hypothetical protein